jgi:hypothetical protein
VTIEEDQGGMMKHTYYGLIVGLAVLIALTGCGGGMGAPGSSGSDSTGIVIKSVSISPTNIDVDTAVHLCPGGTPEPGLFREDATLAIDATKLIPDSADDPFSASVEECTITYLKANDDPASPIIESMTVYPNCTLIDGTNSCTMVLMDVQRKIKWWDDLTLGASTGPCLTTGLFGAFCPAEYPTQYAATIKCKYVNAFGKAGFFQTEVDLWLADWNLC